MQGRRQPHAAPRPRWLALALALLCAGGPLASVVHLLLVRHVTCVEHGELIHADGRGPAHPAGAGVSLEADGGGGATHRHDHCVVMAQPPVGATAPRVEVAAAAAQAGGSSPAPARDGAHPRPVPLLHLAPKGSPPA